MLRFGGLQRVGWVGRACGRWRSRTASCGYGNAGCQRNAPGAPGSRLTSISSRGLVVVIILSLLPVAGTDRNHHLAPALHVETDQI